MEIIKLSQIIDPEKFIDAQERQCGRHIGNAYDTYTEFLNIEGDLSLIVTYPKSKKLKNSDQWKALVTKNAEYKKPETPTEKLLAILPKKYYDRVKSLTEESDLTDGCKYLLEWTDGYTDGECYGGTFPVFSLREAARFVRESIYKGKGAQK